MITGGITFQEKVVQRYAEQIALSGGVSDYGVFQLQAQGDFLDPFEGSGVDTQWEFRMQKAANPFDYGSIADVLLTIEYEAMYNYNYEQSVAQQLNNEPPSANLAFSFKNNLPDQWFDLNNPEQTDTPFAVRFLLSARDQVPNMSDTMIQQVAIFFVMNDGTFFQEVVRLGHDTDPNAENISASEAVPNENLISTRMNAQGFMSLQGTPGPAGAWLFGLADTSNTRSMFASGKVDDIVLIITYDGDSVKYLA
ncbi:MAG: hypothetical protein IPF78_04315 [Flavobacteriales bacterium]|nr:hypothetical protein [Flavobacteriales bacterium]